MGRMGPGKIFLSHAQFIMLFNDVQHFGDRQHMPIRSIPPRTMFLARVSGLFYYITLEKATLIELCILHIKNKKIVQSPLKTFKVFQVGKKQKQTKYLITQNIYVIYFSKHTCDQLSNFEHFTSLRFETITGLSTTKRRVFFIKMHVSATYYAHSLKGTLSVLVHLQRLC